MVGRFLRVCGKIQNLIFEPLPILWCAWKIDRRVRRKTGALQNLLCPESAEFDPGIFPWVFAVGKISIYTIGLNQESHSTLKLVFRRLGIFIINQECSFT